MNITVEEKFLNAYDEHSESIFRHIYFRVNHKETTEDIVQETFFKAWRYISSGEKEIENFKTFFYTVANNLIIDHYRQKPRQVLSLEEREQDIPQEPEQEKQAEQVINKELTKKYINILKDEWKQIIIYRYVNGLSMKEISEITGKSSGNIRIIIHRAIKSIKNNTDNV